jgi:8-oxo-dGTP pyrophosphatase MutT (NUDIX family)
MFDIISQFFASYSALYPEETFPILFKQITEWDIDITSRKNFTGHVTADGCVIDPKAKKVLMIYHKTHQKWFHPGWHIDPEDTHPVEAALREVLEETGVVPIPVLDSERNPLLLHMDSHSIPASNRKSEPEHWHHGMTFLFTADSTCPLSPTDDNGVQMCEWQDILVAHDNPRYSLLWSKIEL